MKTIEQLQEENDALAAQVEALRGADAILAGIANGLTNNPVSVAKGYVTGFGEQHLAEIRAEAGRAGFVEGFKLGTQTTKPAPDNCASAIDFVAYQIEKFANIKAHEYAEQIRQREVK